jgi:hypothetical protein
MAISWLKLPVINLPFIQTPAPVKPEAQKEPTYQVPAYKPPPPSSSPQKAPPRKAQVNVNASIAVGGADAVRSLSEVLRKGFEDVEEKVREEAIVPELPSPLLELEMRDTHKIINQTCKPEAEKDAEKEALKKKTPEDPKNIDFRPRLTEGVRQFHIEGMTVGKSAVLVNVAEPVKVADFIPRTRSYDPLNLMHGTHKGVVGRINWFSPARRAERALSEKSGKIRTLNYRLLQSEEQLSPEEEAYRAELDERMKEMKKKYHDQRSATLQRLAEIAKEADAKAAATTKTTKVNAIAEFIPYEKSYEPLATITTHTSFAAKVKHALGLLSGSNHASEKGAESPEQEAKMNAHIKKHKDASRVVENLAYVHVTQKDEKARLAEQAKNATSVVSEPDAV